MITSNTIIKSHHAYVVRLVAVVLSINIFVCILSVFFLHKAKQQVENDTKKTTENLSLVLAQNISGSIDKINLILLSTTDEIERQLSNTNIEKLPLEALLNQERKRLPELHRVMVANAQGKLIFGMDRSRTFTKSVLGRDYFIRLRDDPNAKLAIERPAAGVVDGKWIQVFARRINGPDGSFAGVVIGSIALEHFVRLFSSIDVGEHGAITLRGKDLAIVARYPENRGIGNTVGLNIVSNTFRQLIESGKDRAIYKANYPVDNIERIHSFHKISDYPLYVNVGLATNDYTAAWHQEVMNASGLVLIFTILTCLASWWQLSNYKKELQIKKELHKYSQLLNKTGNMARIGGWELDIATMKLFWSEQLYQILEVNQDAIVSVEYAINFYKQEARPVIKDAVKSLIEYGTSFNLELPIITAMDNDIWVQVQGEAVCNEGKIYKIFGSFQDITERKKGKEELVNTYKLLNDVQRLSHIGGWKCDIATGLHTWTDEVYLIYGVDKDFNPSDLNKCLKFYAPEYIQSIVNAFERAVTYGDPFDLEVRLAESNAEHIWVRVTGNPSVKDGKIHQITGYIANISNRRNAEEGRLNLERQLLHSQKLESLGVLAGGIAHDFNNILTVIMGNANLALMRIPESPATENLHQIEKAAARAADLAKQMLAYSGKGKFVVEQINLNQLLEEMLHLLQVSISKKAIIRLNLAKTLSPVNADATQMRQIIMNLIINASESIGVNGGAIDITTGCMDCDRHYLNDVWLDESLAEGLYVYLEITDTGCGMDKSTMAKLFDPFFTTKFTGRGLGMSAVLGIVRGHLGAIKVYSELGKGTTFKILFPASNIPVELVNGQNVVDNWKGSGTVLLVDDEETIRGIGSVMLKELGFTPITANNGHEALEIFKGRDDISFVILDLTMPEMDGAQCFSELRMLKPDAKVIISSGYSEQVISDEFIGKVLAGFIQKPYTLSALKEVIKKIGYV